MTEDLMELARDLTRRGEAFALATVVWRRGPSSGEKGYRAIVTAAGRVRGVGAIKGAIKYRKDVSARPRLRGHELEGMS